MRIALLVWVVSGTKSDIAFLFLVKPSSGRLFCSSSVSGLLCVQDLVLYFHVIHMSTRSHSFENGGLYALYNRGNSRQVIFIDEDDYRTFQKILFAMNTSKGTTMRQMGKDPFAKERDQEDQLVSIGAYTLMPNHFHLLCTQVSDDGISKFMLKVKTAYVMYFNNKYERSGSLFEGRFKSKPLTEEKAIKRYFAYIHLNHLKLITPDWMTKLQKRISPPVNAVTSYHYSSVPFYTGEDSDENCIVDTQGNPHYLMTGELFVDRVLEWITLEE